MAEQLNIILVPHTHWDREWYQTFQQFRMRLVKTVDRLLDILEQEPNFSYFMLDGQTILLEDYLEIKSEQEARLRKYIRAGRILIGPWYVQPDEFLVSGEALIRNLQLGFEQTQALGGPMRVGYVPDCFGHIAQLPQLLRGFGIPSAVFWRGVGEEVHKSEFSWAAPDGSKVLVIYLADPLGYSNARQMPLDPAEFVKRAELLIANLLPKATTNMLLFMNGSDHLEPQAGLPEVIASANKLLSNSQAQSKEHSSARGNYSSVHIEIGTLPAYIERIGQHNNHLETLSGEMRSSRYAHLLPAVLSTRMWIKQQNSATEHLLEHWVEPLTAWSALLGKSYPAGLLRAAWKYLLQNHPHDSICGCSIDQVHRENSVRFAQSQQIAEGVLSQAMQDIASYVDTRAPFPVTHVGHEAVPLIVFNPGPGPRSERIQTVVQLPGSLHNASIVDQQGQHMPYRVINRWRQEIGSMPVARETLAAAVAISGIDTPLQLIQMAQSMIMSSLGQSEETHVISRIHVEEPDSQTQHNPLSAGVVSIEIMIAPKGRVFISEQELITAGQHVLDLAKRGDIHTMEITLIDQARETIEFLASGLPAYGYKTFWLYPRGLPIQANAPRTEQRAPTTLQAHENSIENEFYRVEANRQDGTLTITDKQSGVVFTGLNRFIDGGDVGDLYTYCPPEQDQLISEPQEPPRIELVNAGPVQATLRISGRWALPGACTANRNERSVRSVICPISSDISLTPGLHRIELHTRVENRAKDHRLRAIFPVSYIVEQVNAEGSFEVRSRPVAQSRPADVSEWAEEPVNTFPQKRFVDLSNGQTGLAILNRGLPEYEVIQRGPGLAEGQMAGALTLLRCVEWLSRGDLATRHGHAGPMEHTPEAQCQGHYEFDYALVPHQGTWEAEEALVLREAQAFNIPVTSRVAVTGQHSGKLAAQSGLLSIEPRELVLSALKRRNQGSELVVRIYNPLARTIKARIQPGFAFQQAYRANLLEEYQDPIEIGPERSIEVSIGGGSIVTCVFA
ncbi:hypothetical protein EPA93_32280 [Ktedonosporobacter rubrisoli]|uniref:Glycoside hydrolase family 38 central domain-containing protein n=1 Tax=Ktedonosporobacter rubrisoli TaxID=2509675 RepID=A0A4P6JXC6_KTERU|nr:glycoside hydrolase family 38 C-terminal domain-containing protein [Ktedonosporobacter rubrisoli]QBD80399.1 hypothetical protein EPA93_32280 [Ktedonosporobacter rubrisoli]